MRTARAPITIAALALATLLVAPAAPARAQLGVGGTTVGLEAGLPLVFGLEVTQRVSSGWRLGLGFGRIGGLTALRAEGRWLLAREEQGRLVPSLLFGGEQYFLREGDDDATPVGVHAGVGLDYHTAGPVSFGARIGGLKTFGSSGGGGLKIFSVRNGFSTGTFNIGLRYHL